MGVMAAVYLLAFTWTGTVTTVWSQKPCPQAIPCLVRTEAQPTDQDECSQFTKPLSCLSDLRDVCDVNETTVTFDIVRRLAVQGCSAGQTKLSYKCDGFSTCISRTEFTQTTFKAFQNLTAVSHRLVDATFWCRYVEQVIACVINHSCSALENETLRRIQPLYQLMTTACAGEDTVAGGCDVGCQLTCRASMEECRAGLDSLNTSITCNDDNTVPDICKALQDVRKCVRAAPLDPCLNVSWFQAELRDLDTNVELSCSAKAVCLQQLQKCACATRFDLLGNPCQNYTRSLQCVDSIPGNCRAHSDLQALMDNFRGRVSAFIYMQCDPKGGACPDAIQCILHWRAARNRTLEQGAASIQPQHRTQAELSSHIPVLFECLETVSRACNIHQGTVTFQQLKAVISDNSTDVVPDPSPAQCPQFETCITQALPRVPSVLDLKVGEGQIDLDTLRTVAHLMASFTRTGFWCSILESEYRCIVDNAAPCSLPANVTAPVSQQLKKLKDLCVGAATVAPYLSDEDRGVTTIVNRSNTGAAIGSWWVTWSGAALLLSLRPLLSQ